MTAIRSFAFAVVCGVAIIAPTPPRVEVLRLPVKPRLQLACDQSGVDEMLRVCRARKRSIP